jgi:two-component system LytT family sensor kinase
MLSYVAWLLFWSIVQILVLHRLSISWRIAVIDASVSNALLFVAGLVTVNLFHFYQPGNKKYFFRIIWGIVFTALYMVAVNYLLSAILRNESSYLLFLQSSLPIRFAFSLLIIAFLTVIGWMWNYAERQRLAESRKSDTEKLFREAELAKLRQQLHPHLLFNSLNSISALVGSRPEEARKMIQQLSDFLRGTLRKDDQQLASFSEELELLHLYMEIEKVRFSHRLTAEITCDEACKKMLLPPLLLQPLVENAIKFGLYDTTEAVTIKIDAKADNGMLSVTISNPYDPQTAQPRQGAGFGLESVKKRLYLVYFRNDLLVVKKDATVFHTLLKIPQPNA